MGKQQRELTNEDLRERSQALNEAQESWEKVAYTASKKMLCPECGGSGNVDAGSLGSCCPRCQGGRVLDDPNAELLELPPFAELRGAITKYGVALADRTLPAGVRKNLPLPAIDSVPSVKVCKDLNKTAKALMGPSPAALTAGTDDDTLDL